jgi:hypothetical protein
VRPLLESPIAGRQVAVLAYGSLRHEPGPVLQAVIASRAPCRTPFPVEYGRASARWGGGPVLVPHRRGGEVDGELLCLSASVGLGDAVEILRQREGLPDGRGVVHVELPGRDDLVVIAASLPRNLPVRDMEPEALASRAITSVANGAMNGIAYLRMARACGIETPSSAAYAEAICARVGVGDLQEAEARLLALRD